MSAIAGMFRPQGPDVSSSDVERMTEALRELGPDSCGIWCDDRIGFGHRMLHTTPESLEETLPCFHPAARLAITADARLDNRAELIEALGLRDRREAEVTDSDLLLAAYERWGASSLDRLVGDFAYAIWDGRRRQVFCARDHFGVKPLYYYRSGKLFAFATGIHALFEVGGVRRRLNRARVAAFLQGDHEDKAATFFEEILRLPPAHFLTVRAEGAELRQYWRLDPTREVRRRSNEEYAEEYRALFVEAVRSRLRSALPVGSTLSGGLDSSSVASAARNLLRERGSGPLHTFSARFQSIPKVDEGSHMRSLKTNLSMRVRLLQEL
jgi:asparagine synthase (glutamine-hydrolysing)